MVCRLYLYGNCLYKNMSEKTMRQSLSNRFQALLYRLVFLPGDNDETVLLKKIWWIFVGACVVFPGIEVITALWVGETDVALLSGVFVSLNVLLLAIFHFYRKKIALFGLAFQLMIVAVTSIKTMLTGGLVYTAGVVYVGLIGPIQAVIFPDKKRAVFIFLLYIFAVLGGSLAQPYFRPDHPQPDAYFLLTYITKFIFGTFFVFFSLNYFTGQLRRMKAEEAKRMKAVDDLKTRFYTDITHEFRTPLSVILGMADQVRRNPDKWLEEGTDLIRSNGNRLLALVNQMLDLSKLEAKAMPVTLVQDDIVEYTRYLTESFHSVAEQKKLSLTFDSDLPQLYMDFDPEKIELILMNLLSNAVKFTQEGGCIVVTPAKRSGPDRDFFTLTVRDNGIGIPPHLTGRVFDRYFQVETHATPASAGTGLGLALTKEVIDLLGGRIELDSTLGAGSTFCISLPINQEAPKRRSALHRHLPESTGAVLETKGPNGHASLKNTSGLSVLVVEDNPDVVRYLQSVLEEEHRVEVAFDGISGWEKAAELIPDLIISDVMMPGMDGFALCGRLKNDLRTSHIPVILLTARADMPSKIEGLERGADAYIAKPFHREELSALIRNLIETRKKLQARFKTLSLQDGGAAVFSEQEAQEHEFLQEIRRTMERHLSEEDFGISELCRAMGMSRSQLYRKFQALTDHTVHHYIRDIRLNRAKEMLATTNMTVSEVALETGFRNLSHFSRVFSECFGAPPSEAMRIWDK